MPFNLKVEGIIGSVIFTERNIIDWNEYKTNILNNLNNINFNEKIENYISSDKSLHVTKPRMRKILYNSIVLNNNIFMEVGYNSYSVKEQYDIKQQDVYNFIEECIKILVKKQQLK
jgi:hypothetical protein